MTDACEVACQLPEAGLQARLEELRSGILSRVCATRDLPDGLALAVAAGAANERALEEFVAFERQCCGFARYAIRRQPEAARLWLEVTGPEGTREFVRALLVRSAQAPPGGSPPPPRALRAGLSAAGAALAALLLCATPLLGAILAALGLGATAAAVASSWLDRIAAVAGAGSLLLLGFALWRRSRSPRLKPPAPARPAPPSDAGTRPG